MHISHIFFEFIPYIQKNVLIALRLYFEKTSNAAGPRASCHRRHQRQLTLTILATKTNGALAAAAPPTQS